jgi:hypothetical protein
MYRNPPRSNDWDGYDWWQLISYVGTAASVIALLAKPKLAGKLGKVATAFGVASTAHAALTPPKCKWCSSRMSRPKPLYQGAPAWVCGCGNALYPSS